MARLVVPGHPDRVFKDDNWDGYETASGYRSIGDNGYPTPRYGDLWAFAIPFEVESDSLERAMFNDIVNLAPPFVVAEVCRLGDGTPCAIGFYPEP
jgi:hypothetical protein